MKKITGLACAALLASGATGANFTIGGTGHETLAAALAAAQAGDVIVVAAAGSPYLLSEPASVPAGVEIQGETGNPDDVVFEYVLGSDAKGHRMFDLAQDGACLNGITVSGGYYKGGGCSGANVSISGAGCLVTNCVIRNASTWNNNQTNGAGIFLNSASTVTHCVITNNLIDTTQNNDTYGGAGIQINNARAVLAHSLIAYNVATNISNGSNSQIGAGVYASGGTITNCTIVGNKTFGTSMRQTAGVKSAGSTIVDCIIAGNVAENGAEEAYSEWNGTASNFKNCLSTVAINNSSCHIVSLPFVHAEAGDWRPSAAAPIQVGAIESTADDLAQPSVTFVASARQGVASADEPLTLTFTALTAHVDAGVTYAWDLDGDGVFSDAEKTTARVQTWTYTAPLTARVRVKVLSSTGALVCETKDALSVRIAPRRMYVSRTGGNSAPYATEADAATDLSDALALAADGTEIIVSPGVYDRTKEIFVRKGVEIRGASGKPEDVVFNRDETANLRLFTFDHPRAILSHVTVSGGNGSTGGNILFANDGFGATIADCIIRNGKTGTNQRGGGIAMQAPGLLTHCVISNNTITTGDNDYRAGGAAVSMYNKDCILRNCLITGNSSVVTPQHQTAAHTAGGTIWILNGAMIENCTIVGNHTSGTSTNQCPGIFSRTKSTNIKISNCLIADNECAITNDFAQTVFIGLEKKNDVSYPLDVTAEFTYCAAPVVINPAANAGCFAFSRSDSVFRNPAKGDWRLVSDSVAIDKGLNQSWMNGACDLAGNPRVYKDKTVDLGCYEYVSPGGLRLIFR